MIDVSTDEALFRLADEIVTIMKENPKVVEVLLPCLLATWVRMQDRDAKEVFHKLIEETLQAYREQTQNQEDVSLD